jgi:hypothetical protein
MLRLAWAHHSIAFRRGWFVSFAKMLVVGLCFGETHDIDNIR